MMTQIKQHLKQLAADDTGQDLIEYALVAALIGVAAVSAMRVLSNSIGKSFNGVGNSLTNAVA
jgi:pilus assembly protein Flp/PilA